MLDLVPFQVSMKTSLRHHLSSLCHPILGDWSVLVHMTMLIILRPDSSLTTDPAVDTIIKQLWTMLRRYLTNIAACADEVEYSLAHIQYCLHTLPNMLEHNKEVFSKFV